MLVEGVVGEQAEPDRLGVVAVVAGHQHQGAGDLVLITDRREDLAALVEDELRGPERGGRLRGRLGQIEKPVQICEPIGDEALIGLGAFARRGGLLTRSQAARVAAR